jgi:hypothetical protein
MSTPVSFSHKMLAAFPTPAEVCAALQSVDPDVQVDYVDHDQYKIVCSSPEKYHRCQEALLAFLKEKTVGR